MSRSFLFCGLSALFFALQLGGCGESPVGPEGEGLWPMAVGNRWIGVREYFNLFGESLGTDRDTMSVVRTVAIGGETWYEFNNGALRTNRQDGVWARSSESAKDEYLIPKYSGCPGGDVPNVYLAGVGEGREDTVGINSNDKQPLIKPRHLRSMRFFLLFRTAILLAVLLPSLAQGQTDELPDWQIAAGGTAIHISELNGTGFGPTALLSRYFGDRIGAEFGPTIIVWSDGFYRAGGLSADLGVVYSGRTDRTELAVTAGPSVLAVSDSDGTFLALGGGYVGVRGTWWPGGDRLGLFARGSVRLWHTGEFSPAASAGLSIRF